MHKERVQKRQVLRKLPMEGGGVEHRPLRRACAGGEIVQAVTWDVIFTL